MHQSENIKINLITIINKDEYFMANYLITNLHCNFTGIHRELGVNISKVRSLRMDTKVFNERKSLIKVLLSK